MRLHLCAVYTSFYTAEQQTIFWSSHWLRELFKTIPTTFSDPDHILYKHEEKTYQNTTTNDSTYNSTDLTFHHDHNEANVT